MDRPGEERRARPRAGPAPCRAGSAAAGGYEAAAEARAVVRPRGERTGGSSPLGRDGASGAAGARFGRGRASAPVERGSGATAPGRPAALCLVRRLCGLASRRPSPSSRRQARCSAVESKSKGAATLAEPVARSARTSCRRSAPCRRDGRRHRAGPRRGSAPRRAGGRIPRGAAAAPPRARLGVSSTSAPLLGDQSGSVPVAAAGSRTGRVRRVRNSACRRGTRSAPAGPWRRARS